MGPRKKSKSRKASSRTSVDWAEALDHASTKLGTALGTVLGELTYALESEQPQIRERALSLAVAAAEDGMQVTHNLRYLAHYTDLRLSCCDLTQVLLDSIDWIENQMLARGIAIKVTTEANTTISADADALRQIFFNLLVQITEHAKSGDRLGIVLFQSSEKQVKVELRLSGTFSQSDSKSHSLEQQVIQKLLAAHNTRLEQAVTSAEKVISVSFAIQKGEHPSRAFNRERRYRRVRITLPAEIRLRNQVFTLQVSVLSAGGCFTEPKEVEKIILPELDETVELTIFHLRDKGIVIPKCRIASLCWTGKLSGLGVEFLEMDSHTKMLLANIVRGNT